MRETTIRRLLVLVLCASGVVALWIVADRSLPTPDAGIPVQPGTVSRSGIRPAPSLVPTATSQPPTRSATATTEPDPAGHPADQRRGQEQVSRRHPAGGPVPGADPKPAAVRGLRVIQSDHDSITIRWDPVTRTTDTDQATGKAGPVAYYHATLNGIPVGDTAGLELTINWFNDDMTSHFIRVNAIGPDGTRGLSGNALVVDRPTAPTPTPPATPDSPTADPTTSDSPQPDPDRTTSPAPSSTPEPTSSQTPAPTGTPSPPDTVPPTSAPPQTGAPVAPDTPGDPALAPTDPAATNDSPAPTDATNPDVPAQPGG